MNSGTSYYWLAAIALFWIPPVFVASWLGDVKRTNNTERPWTWGLIGWLGTLIYAIKRPLAVSDPEAARSRSRLVAFLSLIGICASVAFAVYANDHVKEPVSSTVARMTGESSVKCNLEGWILIAGERSDVYGCSRNDYAGGVIGCFAKVGDLVQDVTDQAKALAALGGARLPCVSA